MELLLVMMIAISLSMDAFSLSLAYGTLGISKRQIYLLSIIVGVFHFFMPLIGMFVGNSVFSFLKFSSDWVVFVVLLIIGIQMAFESFKEHDDVKIMKIPEFFIFAFAVSLDSFSVGLTLNNFGTNYIFSALIFAITSLLFTFVGLLLGNKIKKSVGKVATFIGGVVLILIGFISVV